MNPVKIAGGFFVLLGLLFRGICVAVFRQRAKQMSADRETQRRFAASQQRAFIIDAGFIVFGFYLILAH